MSTEIHEEKHIHKVSKLNESTLLPLSLVFVVIGCVYWVSSLSFQVQANATQLNEMTKERKEYLQTVNSLQNDVSTIKGMLEAMQRGRK